MEPNDQTRINALIDLTRRLHKQAGDQVLVRDLYSHWSETGLRVEDFDRAVTYAVARGLLREHRTDFGPMIECCEAPEANRPIRAALGRLKHRAELFTYRLRRAAQHKRLGFLRKPTVD